MITAAYRFARSCDTSNRAFDESNLASDGATNKTARILSALPIQTDASSAGFPKLRM